MKDHIGVDLHQRFCYLTAVDANGKLYKQEQVINEGAACVRGCGSCRSPAGGGGGMWFLASLSACCGG